MARRVQRPETRLYVRVRLDAPNSDARASGCLFRPTLGGGRANPVAISPLAARPGSVTPLDLQQLRVVLDDVEQDAVNVVA